MKTKIYFFLTIFMIGICGCGETKVNEPSHGIGFFELTAKLTHGQCLEVKIINTMSHAKGFIYVDRAPSENMNLGILPGQLRVCFKDTLILSTETNHILKLYQFKDMDDGSIGLQEHSPIYLDQFFKIN